MGDRVVEGGEIEVSHPLHAAFVLTSDLPLKSSVSLLPATKEEDAIRLLEDVAENDLELKWSAAALHSFRSEICECL